MTKQSKCEECGNIQDYKLLNCQECGEEMSKTVFKNQPKNTEKKHKEIKEKAIKKTKDWKTFFLIFVVIFIGLIYYVKNGILGYQISEQLIGSIIGSAFMVSYFYGFAIFIGIFRDHRDKGVSWKNSFKSNVKGLGKWVLFLYSFCLTLIFILGIVAILFE